jgi:hypothetical protein
MIGTAPGWSTKNCLSSRRSAQGKVQGEKWKTTSNLKHQWLNGKNTSTENSTPKLNVAGQKQNKDNKTANNLSMYTTICSSSGNYGG